VTVISLLGLILACPTGGSSGSTAEPAKDTPVSTDFTVSGNGTFSATGTGAQKFDKVTVTPNAGKSQGKITVKYNDSETVPSATTAGLYTVTFDVGEDTSSKPGWNAVSGFSAGFVNITDERKVPLIEHFDISDFPASWIVGKAPSTLPAVRVRDASLGLGAITTSYKNKDVPSSTATTTFPTGVGTYDVTFTVAANEIWNAAGFTAGSIFIRAEDEQVQVTPLTFGDLDVILKSPTYGTSKTFTAPENSGTAALEVDYSGDAQRIIITPKPGSKADGYAGTISLTYNDASGTTPVMIPDASDKVGKYSVNVSLAGYVKVNTTTGQTQAAWAGTDFTLWYNIVPRTPSASDYDISKLIQAEQGTLFGGTQVTHVVFARKPVARVPGVNASPGVPAVPEIPEIPGIASKGKITIYYTLTSTEGDATYDGSVGIEQTGVTTPVSPETRTYIVFENTGSKVPPKKAGTYKVTFTVAAPNTNFTANGAVSTDDIASWKALTTPVEAGTLVLKPLVPVNADFVSFWVDDDKDILDVSNSRPLAYPGDLVNFKKSGPGKVVEWRVDGKLVKGNTTDDYTFSSTALGTHVVSLVVSYNNKLYNKNSTVTVQPK